MSLLDTASLLLTPNAYKEDKLYSVIPSDGSGDFTFTRATSATRVNAEGLIETASVLGSELVVNGDFATNSIWTTPTGWSISNGTLQGTNANAISATQSGFSFLNKSFKVEYTITEISQGGIIVFLGGVQSTPQRSAVGTYVEYIDITSGNSTLYIYGINFTGKIDNVSVKEVITFNIPRLDYSNGTCPSLLVEPQRTNLAYPSIPNNYGNGTYTFNDAISPDGTQNASSFVPSGNGLVYANSLSTTAQTYTFSVYLKGTVNGQKVGLGDNNVILNTFTLTTSWQRYTFTFTGSVQTTAFYLLSGNYFSPAENNKFYIWGAQLELGNYQTSYIPTTSASVTRNADVITKTGISSLIGQTEGTVFWEGQVNGFGLYPQLFDLNADGNKFIQIYNDIVFGIPTIGIYVQNVSLLLSNPNIATIAYNTHFKFALGYKNNDYVAYLNGVQVFTNTSIGVPPTSNFGLGDAAQGVSTSKKNVKATALWKTRLTNDQLAQLTTI